MREHCILNEPSFLKIYLYFIYFSLICLASPPVLVQVGWTFLYIRCYCFLPLCSRFWNLQWKVIVPSEMYNLRWLPVLLFWESGWENWNALNFGPSDFLRVTEQVNRKNCSTVHWPLYSPNRMREKSERK